MQCECELQVSQCTLVSALSCCFFCSSKPCDFVHVCPVQVKVVLEKAKQSLDAEHSEMANELKLISAARLEAERKRKHAEQQLQEVTFHVAEMEKGRGDLGEKATKLQVPFWLVFYFHYFSLNEYLCLSCLTLSKVQLKVTFYCPSGTGLISISMPRSQGC